MPFQAGIFDLDGVISDTAKVHLLAWKQMFDAFLKIYSEETNQPFVAFTEQDYLQFVDGKPRVDGATSFLESRHITLPLGNASDTSSVNSIYGLASEKQDIFLDYINQNGVPLFESTLAFIKALHENHIKTAVVSSSKNCQKILNKAGIESLFLTRIDGSLLGTLGLQGKPQPDMFLEAAKQIDVLPENAFIVEDAISGIQAGSAGHFGLVIGIDRHQHMAQAFYDEGADIVVTDLSDISVQQALSFKRNNLKPALNHVQNIKAKAKGKNFAFFLDYDGTLTPIVSRPEYANASKAMQDGLRQLNNTYPVAIISGRELSDVQERVNIPELYYAGNHGFEIQGPHGYELVQEITPELLQTMQTIANRLQEKFASVPGFLIENKKASLSVHYRLVDDKQLVRSIENSVDDIVARHPELSKHLGKKVFELRPNIEWNKGKVVLRLLRELQSSEQQFVPVYIGDDVTDEDAFRAINNFGISILVTSEPKQTEAHYSLSNPDQVLEFLNQLIEID